MVADALVAAGVPRSIISADGRGEANPVASNATAEGRARHRGIEVTLVGPGD
jgi:outer membrane protein OmpA-like peptidoglycan-associated protein